MAELIRPDICVIGAGPAGAAAAAAASSFGASIVLVEKADMGGETLRHNGAVPAQALLAAATRVQAVRSGGSFGLKVPRFAADFTALNAQIGAVVATLAPNVSKERFIGLGVRVVKGAARFSDADTVLVDDTAIKADRFIVATGSSPRIPAVPGLIEAPHLTAATLSDLTRLPRHLVVIGAGAIGLALAQAFRRFGAEVTVLEAAEPLAGEDRECVGVLLDALEREGVKLRTGVEIAKVTRSLGNLRVVLARPGDDAVISADAGGESIDASHLLVAAGRRPNIDDLDLDAAGVRRDPHGIVVDANLMTSNKRVYAVGGVAGASSTHAATHQARVAVRHALSRAGEADHSAAVPRVIYTDPQLAQVGLVETQAPSGEGRLRVLRWPYRENDRAQSERTTAGHIKVVTDAKGDILGATIVGAQAAESIAAWTLAIDHKLNIRDLADLVVPYPSFAEIGQRAAMSYFAHGLTSRRGRRIMAWLRHFG